MDGDGDLDLITFRDEQGVDPLNQLWLNDGQGQFSAGGQFANHTGFLATGDLDRDSDLDVLLANNTELVSRLNINDVAITVGRGRDSDRHNHNRHPCSLHLAFWRWNHSNG